MGPTYGMNISGTLSETGDVTSAERCQIISLVHYLAQEIFTQTAHSTQQLGEDGLSSNSSGDRIGTETHTMKTRSLNQLDLSEGRSLLVLGLLRKLLEAKP